MPVKVAHSIANELMHSPSLAGTKVTLLLENALNM